MSNKLETLFEDKIETPTLNQVLKREVSLGEYISKIPTKVGEYIYGCFSR